MKRANIDEKDWLSTAFADLLDNDLLSSTSSFDGENVLAGLEWDSKYNEDDDVHAAVDAVDAATTTASSKDNVAVSLLDAPYAVPQSNDLQAEAAEIMAKELRNMSLQERDLILEDLHGTASPDEESQVFLDAKLDDMDTLLTTASANVTEDMTAYNLAKQQKPPFTQDTALRLKCLRCVRYNPVLAANRLARFFHVKLELFGEDMLTEHITIQDLCPEAQQLMASGRAQVLPKRDSSGRALITSLHFTPDMFATLAPAQCFFYWCMSLLEDEDVQRAGVVCINALHDHSVAFTQVQKANYCKCARTSNTLPIKFQGFHFLAARDPIMHKIANLLQLTLPRSIRHRFRIHYGTFQQSKMSLMGFGIPVSALPFTNDGTIKLVEHDKWLNRRRKLDASILIQRQIEKARNERKEQNSSSNDECSGDGTPQMLLASNQPLSPSQTVYADQNNDRTISTKAEPINPVDVDVLLGRGRPFQEHPGNMYLKKLITDWYIRYNESSRLEKSVVAEQLVMCIQQRNGRFLKLVDGSWQQVSRLEARNKVSHSFRKKREMDAAKLRVDTAIKRVKI